MRCVRRQGLELSALTRANLGKEVRVLALAAPAGRVTAVGPRDIVEL
jgi:hypothetical protein